MAYLINKYQLIDIVDMDMQPDYLYVCKRFTSISTPFWPYLGGRST